MTIPPFVPGAFTANQSTSDLLNLESQLTNLQTQLSTGQVSQTYSGLGSQAATALQFQQSLSLNSGYQANATDVTQRLTLANSALDSLNSSVSSMSSQLVTSSTVTAGTGETTTQEMANGNFQQAVDLLNTQYGSRYLFSGRATTTQPVTNSSSILNGTSTAAGLTQVIQERNEADLGIVPAASPAVDPPSTGRLVLASSGNTTTISEDVAGSPFGFKLGAAAPSTTSQGISVSGPTGSPASISVGVTAQPAIGDTVSFTLTLPDQTTTTLTLTASQSVNGGANATNFQIGGTAAQTAVNLNSAITQAIQTASATSLKAASSVVAAQSFFSQTATSPAERVATLPATTATALVAGNATGALPTLSFYNGDNQPTASSADIAAIRASGATQIDSGVTANVGVQANEPAFVTALASFGVLSAVNFNPADPNEQAFYQAIASRVQGNLTSTSTETVADVQSQLATTAQSVQTTTAVLTSKASYYQGIVDGIENTNTTTVSAQILSLQTQLEASFQTANILSKLSLTQYLH